MKKFLMVLLSIAFVLNLAIVIDHFFRIIDKVRQPYLVLLRNNMSKCLADLLPDNTRRTAEQINKRLMLTVQVTEKIFRALRKSTDCL